MVDGDCQVGMLAGLFGHRCCVHTPFCGLSIRLEAGYVVCLWMCKIREVRRLCERRLNVKQSLSVKKDGDVLSAVQE